MPQPRAGGAAGPGLGGSSPRASDAVDRPPHPRPRPSRRRRRAGARAVNRPRVSTACRAARGDMQRTDGRAVWTGIRCGEPERCRRAAATDGDGTGSARRHARAARRPRGGRRRGQPRGPLPGRAAARAQWWMEWGENGGGWGGGGFGPGRAACARVAYAGPAPPARQGGWGPTATPLLSASARVRWGMPMPPRAGGPCRLPPAAVAPALGCPPPRQRGRGGGRFGIVWLSRAQYP
ncbi:hypothetical protein GQ55_4G326500 [Panicum hallii var. hallii]|uniref:Uncharacterized protein n=1 Tax=Panicum hallii var. hallii TaxID=1504633 RepID=A0A2T7E2G3_9POAL|nr:hypothetical protein GQ55_4G326500 [Panicum hallii var. hallii]